MPKPRLRAFLLVAAFGSVLILVDLLGSAGGFAGLALMLVGAALTAPAAPQQGSGDLNWWGLLSAGFALALVGVPLELVLETPGGLLAAVGAGLGVVGAALGWP